MTTSDHTPLPDRPLTFDEVLKAEMEKKQKMTDLLFKQKLFNSRRSSQMNRLNFELEYRDYVNSLEDHN